MPLAVRIHGILWQLQNANIQFTDVGADETITMDLR
jgi:hypothetical protein